MDMDQSARVFTNPITHDRLQFVELPQVPSQDRLLLRIWLPARTDYLPSHYHLDQDERVLVESGTLTLQFGQIQRAIQAADGWVDVHRGIVHGFRNRADEPLQFLAEVRPGYDLAVAIVANFILAEQGRLSSLRLPTNPLHAGLLFDYHRSYIPLVSVPLQRRAARTLARVGTLLRSSLIRRSIERLESLRAPEAPSSKSG